jgi:hypothetical protein
VNFSYSSLSKYTVLIIKIKGSIKVIFIDAVGKTNTSRTLLVPQITVHITPQQGWVSYASMYVSPCSMCACVCVCVCVCGGGGGLPVWM